MKSRTRRATFISLSQLVDRRTVIGITLMGAMVCGVSSTRGEETSPPDGSLALTLTESAYAPGLVLPLDEPGLGVDSRSLAPAMDLTTSDLEAGSADPIAVPLPPGVATGMIGLASVAIARYRWRLRRA